MHSPHQATQSHKKCSYLIIKLLVNLCVIFLVVCGCSNNKDMNFYINDEKIIIEDMKIKEEFSNIFDFTKENEMLYFYDKGSIYKLEIISSNEKTIVIIFLHEERPFYLIENTNTGYYITQDEKEFILNYIESLN